MIMAFECAILRGQPGALFKDKSGRWLASFFGNDRTAPFRAMPGYVPVETRDTGGDFVVRPQTHP